MALYTMSIMLAQCQMCIPHTCLFRCGASVFGIVYNAKCASPILALPAYMAMYTIPNMHSPYLLIQMWCQYIWHCAQCQVCTEWLWSKLNAKQRIVKIGTSYWSRAKIRGLWLVERTIKKNLRGWPWFKNANLAL